MVVQRPVIRGRLRARAHLPLSPPYLDSGLPGFRGRTAAAHPMAEHQRPDRCEPDELERLRLAPYSNDSRGFANITIVTIGPATQKVTVDLPKGCSGISFQRQDDPGNWATIAYNLGT